MNVLRATRAGTWIGLSAAVLAARRWPRSTQVVTALIAGSFGIAHGAADDMLLAGTLDGPRWSRRTIGTLYGAAAVATFALTRRAPRSGRFALLALTWFHFGSGDAAFAAACAAGPYGRFAWIVPGAVPLATPVPALRPFMKATALPCMLSAAIAGRWSDALDLALPAGAFTAAPSSQTFLSYFALWHAPRHLALIIERYSSGPSRKARVTAFVRAAIFNSSAALVAGALVLRFTNAPKRELVDGLILSITVPHLVAVAYLERSARRA